MGDNLSKVQRSICMSSIRSKWTSQEKKVHGLLKSLKIRHKMHPVLPGNPDILIFPKTAVYLHGCFWHKCPKCYVAPKSRKEYWIPKIESNVKRDRKNKSSLKKLDFKVAIIWEHDVKDNIKLKSLFNRIVR